MENMEMKRKYGKYGNEVDSVNKDESELFPQPTPLSSIYESVLVH